MGDRKIDYGPLRDTLGYHIRLADVATGQTFQQAFAGTGLTPAKFTALELVARNPGIRPAELGEAMAVRSSNLARLLRELEQAGWIEADRAEDRREKQLRLTRRGTAAIRGFRRRLALQNALLGAGLTGDERAQLSALIGRLLAGLRPPD